ncbi:MAG: hypothetical protein KGL32_06770 [candidate division NC10 bacterium]|nr:hypothetical protein [candidate division NC10 bacterium]
MWLRESVAATLRVTTPLEATWMGFPEGPLVIVTVSVDWTGVRGTMMPSPVFATRVAETKFDWKPARLALTV